MLSTWSTPSYKAVGPQHHLLALCCVGMGIHKYIYVYKEKCIHIHIILVCIPITLLKLKVSITYTISVSETSLWSQLRGSMLNNKVCAPILQHSFDGINAGSLIVFDVKNAHALTASVLHGIRSGTVKPWRFSPSVTLRPSNPSSP